jgi:hypothetical protein
MKGGMWRAWFEQCTRLWRDYPLQSLALVLVLLAIADWFVHFSAIQFSLLVLALVLLSPWARLIPHILESAELPGGFKVVFRKITAEAEAAGLLVEPPPPAERSGRPIYEMISNDDPLLALAGLRIALEKRLKDMALIAGIPEGQPLGRIIPDLTSRGVLTAEQSSALADLIPVLNKAVHAKDPGAAEARWAMEVGPRLIAGLDKRAVEAGGSPERLWGNTASSAVLGGSGTFRAEGIVIRDTQRRDTAV